MVTRFDISIANTCLCMAYRGRTWGRGLLIEFEAHHAGIWGARMTLLFEVCGPFQWKPGRYTSCVMYRVWWLWFSVGVLRVPLRAFSERWEE